MKLKLMKWKLGLFVLLVSTSSFATPQIDCVRAVLAAGIQGWENVALACSASES